MLIRVNESKCGCLTQSFCAWLYGATVGINPDGARSWEMKWTFKDGHEFYLRLTTEELQQIYDVLRAAIEPVAEPVEAK
jgi:hypothetical protein